MTIIPDAAQAAFPDYASVFSWANIDGHYVPQLKAVFPDDYFMVVVAANALVSSTGTTPVPNVTTRRRIADGIGQASITGVGVPNIARYNIGTGTVIDGAFAVLDHEIGHNWGAYIGAVPGSATRVMGDGHWLANSTVHGQMAEAYSDDPTGMSVKQIFGDAANGFTWTALDNLARNETETFADQDLYLMGLNPVFPDTYVLKDPVYNADHTVSAASVATYDHAWVVANDGPRVPGYRASEKRLRLGFVYVARDSAEVQAVYQPIERSIAHFADAEQFDTKNFRFQVPFLAATQFRASVNARLADLDGNASPVVTLTGGGYFVSTDGSASVAYQASDADGPAPAVSLLPPSANATIGDGEVTFQGLAPGTHFFTLKAEDALGKKAFAHFVVDVN